MPAEDVRLLGHFAIRQPLVLHNAEALLLQVGVLIGLRDAGPDAEEVVRDRRVRVLQMVEVLEVALIRRCAELLVVPE